LSRLPLLSWREVVKVLAKAGFQVARQKGSHLILIKDEHIVTELLLKSYDSEFLQLILGSNEERKKEIKDENVWNEVEKIKKKVETLEKDWLS
jgi:predicted RNA binding protein YcfA (HicA-like mRNA interferase family)